VVILGGLFTKYLKMINVKNNFKLISVGTVLFILSLFIFSQLISFHQVKADVPSYYSQPSSGGGGDHSGNDDFSSYTPTRSSPDVRSCPTNGATYIDNGDGSWTRYDSNGTKTGNVSDSFVAQNGTKSGAGSGCSGGCGESSGSKSSSDSSSSGGGSSSSGSSGGSSGGSK